MRLILATENAHKVREIRELLSDLTVEVAHLGELDDPPQLAETGATFAENAREKALACARATGELSLADDSGLMVDALGGAPGVRSARYAGEGGTQQDLIAKLLAELAGVPEAEKTARFVCALSLCAPEGEIGRWEGHVEGLITRAPRGEGGFGYDPVFLYPPAGATFAQMRPDEKNAVSHRARALAQFRNDLPAILRAYGS
ncbi:MAG TPA: non-canonical purine NTP pyrophosphatase [Armatimonadetes bacterium]|nr:non-canonical purine NTP pyrophosphatase [Armatimonadota bacterium]